MELAEESEQRSLSIAGTKGLIERSGFSPQVLIHVPGKLPCTSNVSSGSMHARFHGRSSSREEARHSQHVQRRGTGHFIMQQEGAD